MNAFSGDVSSLIFKGSVKGDLDQFSLDSQMLNVLMALDGRKNLAMVSRAVNMDMADLKVVLSRLLKIRLIEKVEKTDPVLNEEFVAFLKKQLSLALGPIAEFLIEDEVRELGVDLDKIPVPRAAELINILARQVPRKEKRVMFQQAMAAKLKEII